MLRLARLHCGESRIRRKKTEVRNLMLLQYPDRADCPQWVKQLKKSEEGLHGSGCGCVCVGKRKTTT